MTTCILGNRPVDYNKPKLLEEAKATWSGVKTINNVDPDLLAIYIRDGHPVPTVKEWQTVIDLHDPLALTDAQLNAERGRLAKEDLKAVGANGVRVQGVPDLAESVALIIEALGLDL